MDDEKALPVQPHQRRTHGAAGEIRAYTRTLRLVPVTFTCATCGRQCTTEQYPGQRLTYCCLQCQEAGQRRKTAERVQRYRARQRAQADHSDETP